MALLATLRNSPRYAEILKVLVKHGFGSFVERTGLHSHVERGKDILGTSADEGAVHPDGVRLRRALEELGPNFIKLGQVLSTRPDLIPADIADEFSKLQSNCPQVDFTGIQTRLEQEFPGRLQELFQSIDPKPLAAGSLAQTHRAVLRDGSRVVLKILRPNVEQVIEADLEVLSTLATFIENHFDIMAFSPRDVVREFSRQIRKELDLEVEGRSTERLSGFFTDNPNIRFPRVHWEATSKRVLAIDEAPGELLSAVKPEELSPEMRQAAVRHGTDAVFRMCLEFGFFHADPHPGNIFVAPDGSVTFIDCGMTGSIDTKSRQELADLMRSVVQGDLDRAVRSAVRVTDADPALEYDRAFRTDTWEIITRFKSDQIGHIDVPGLLNSLFELFRRHHVRCPSDLVYLIKALSTVHGVAKQFAPEFEVLPHLRPHIEKLLKDQYSKTSTRERLIQTLLNYVELAEDLPNEMRAIAAQIRRRDFSVRLEHKGLDNLKDTIDKAARYLSVSFMMGAVVVGSAVLIHAEKDKPGFSFVSIVGILSYLVAGAFGMVLLLGAIIGKHGEKDKK